MSTTNPVAGNQYFTRIQNAAKKFTDLDATNVQAVDGRVVALSADTLLGLGFRSHTVVGVTPSGFSSLAATAEVTLQDANGDNITLPAGALITDVAVKVTTAVTGGTTFNIGTGALNGNLTTTAVALLPTASLATLNNVVAWNAAQSATGEVVPAVSTAASFNYLNVGATTAVTAGALRVAVKYWVPFA